MVITAAKESVKKANSSFFDGFARLLAEKTGRRYLSTISNRRRSVPYRSYYYSPIRKQYTPNHLVTSGVAPGILLLF